MDETLPKLAAEAIRHVERAGGLVYIHPHDDGPAAYALVTLERLDEITGGEHGEAHDHVTPDLLEYVAEQRSRAGSLPTDSRLG